MNVKAVAGDKTFNWSRTITKVFEKKWFDVIGGEMPYVRTELFKWRPYLEKLYYNSYLTYILCNIGLVINLINKIR
jgi:hypothetical protein